MRLKTISYILASLSLGVLSGLVIGLFSLSFSSVSRTELRENITLPVLGIFLGVLSILLFFLSIEIENHAINLEEVKQW